MKDKTIVMAFRHVVTRGGMENKQYNIYNSSCCYITQNSGTVKRLLKVLMVRSALLISFDQGAYSIYTKVVYNYVLVAFGTQRERESASS